MGIEVWFLMALSLLSWIGVEVVDHAERLSSPREIADQMRFGIAVLDHMQQGTESACRGTLLRR